VTGWLGDWEWGVFVFVRALGDDYDLSETIACTIPTPVVVVVVVVVFSLYDLTFSAQ